jgi:hypothetical protein
VKIKEAYYKKDGIVADVIDRIIITNQNEDDSSGDEEDETSSGDTNSDSSDSELAYPLD